VWYVKHDLPASQAKELPQDEILTQHRLAKSVEPQIA